MGRRLNRPKIKIVGHYMQIDGELVEIDPDKAGIPDRCKQVLAEVYTGRKYVLVESKAGS